MSASIANDLDRLMEGRAPGSLDAASLERDPIYAGSVRRHCEAERREILQDHLRYHEKNGGGSHEKSGADHRAPPGSC